MCTRNFALLLLFGELMSFGLGHAAMAADIPPSFSIRPTNIFGACAFSPNGEWLALSGSDSARNTGATTFYDTRTWREVRPDAVQKFETGTSEARPIAWTLDGKHLVVGLVGNNWMGAFMVVSMPDPKVSYAWRSQRTAQNIDRICAVDGPRQIAYTASLADELVVRDFATGKKIFSIPTPTKNQTGLATSEDGKLIAVGDGDTLILANSEQKCILKSKTFPGQICGIAFDPKSENIAVVIYDYKNAYDRGTGTKWLQIVHRKSLTDSGRPQILPGGICELHDISYSASGEQLFLLFSEILPRVSATSPDTAMSFVLVRSSSSLRTIDRLGPVKEDAISMSVAPDGKMLAVSNSNQLSLWTLNSYSAGHTMPDAPGARSQQTGGN